MSENAVFIVFKYLTRKTLPQIQTDSLTHPFRLQGHQIFTGSQSTIQSLYIEIFLCIFSLVLAFFNMLHRRFLKLVRLQLIPLLHKHFYAPNIVTHSCQGLICLQTAQSD